MKVFNDRVQRQFQKQFWDTPQALGLAKGQAQRAVNVAQQAMVQTFLLHPVTLELKSGPNSSNLSNTISYDGESSNANLFSFFGFVNGEDPTEELERMLTNKIIAVNLGGPKDLTYSFKITVPSKNDIEAITPLPWANTLSWAAAIEDGSITNIRKFIPASELPVSVVARYSRSGGGLQIEKLSKNSSFNNRPYVSEIINAFIDKLQQLKFS